METNEPEIGQNPEIVHYKKINIFGDTGVGKSTFISKIENYNKQEENIKLDNSNLKESQLSQSSDNFNISLKDKVRTAKIKIGENNYLYFNLYENDLDDFDFIKNSLSVLLMQTECVIMIWNKNNPNTLKNISNLLSIIIGDNKNNNNIRDFPILLLQNDIDISIRDSQNDLLEIGPNDYLNKYKEDNSDRITFKELDISSKEKLRFTLLEINNLIKNYENKKKDHIRNNDIVNIVKFNPKGLKRLNKDDIKCKCILLGHSFVGKTTYFNCFTENDIINSIATIGADCLNIMAQVNNEKITINLFDTAGQEKYSKLPASVVKEVFGVLLFYDITNGESFEKLTYWINQIRDNNDKDAEIFLIANKIDLSKNRVVSKNDAVNFAKSKNIRYFECSCLLKINVYEILNEIILSSYKTYKKNITNNTHKRNNSIKIENENQKEEIQPKAKTSKCC